MHRLLAVLPVLLLTASTHATTLTITPDATTIPMGHSISLTATLTPDAGVPPGDWLVLPFVNGKRWGAHQWTDCTGVTTFHLPLP